jgi:hypothetical protein
MLVGSAIDFDDEAKTRGEKVRDISAKHGLTSEAHAEVGAPQRLPEQSFRLRGCEPMTTRPIGEFERATV